MSKVATMLEKFNGQSKIRDWYKWAYPTDELGDEINGGATFQKAFECLQVGFDFYAFLGVGDTVIRERVFDGLACLMGCSYEHIYYQWLKKGKNPLGGMLVGNMQGMRFTNEPEEESELEKLAGSLKPEN